MHKYLPLSCTLIKKLIFLLWLIGPAFHLNAQCPDPTSIGTPSVVHASCPGNGQITVNSVTPSPSSISPDYYVYALYDTSGVEVLPYQANNVMNNVQAGSYNIRVARVCASGFSGYISRPVTVNNTETMPVINSITLNRKDVCNNGRFTVSAGGSGPLQYALVDSLTAPNPPASYVRPPQSASVFDSLAAGIYFVRVFNNCGNAVTQQMEVTAYSGPPVLSGPEFAPLGCDSVYFRFSLFNFVNLANSGDTAISRVWVNWPDGSTDSLPVQSNGSGTPNTGTFFTFVGPLSKVDPSYDPSSTYWQNIGTFPFTINYGYKDMCGNNYSSSHVVYESQQRVLFTSASETHSLSGCDSVAYRWQIRYTRTGPSQTIYHMFRNMDGFVYSIDTGASWRDGRAANTLPAGSSQSYSDYFAIPRKSTLLMVAMCGDTLTQVLDSVPIPALTSSMSQNNLRSCLGNSGISLSRQNANGDTLGIEMLTAPPGQAIVPYFSTPSSNQYPLELTNLKTGTYTLRIWDTFNVDCPRFVDRTVNLTHPATLDFTTDIMCNGSLRVTTGHMYRFGNSNQQLSSAFRVQIYDSTGTVLLAGGTNGYLGSPNNPPGFTSVTVPESTINALPDGKYIIRGYKFVTGYTYLPSDTCTGVDKEWIKQPHNLNLVKSKFVPGCPGGEGAIVAIAEGGKPHYTFTLFDSANNIIPPDTPGGNVFDGLNINHTYTLQVIDSCGTIVSRTMSVGETMVIRVANTTLMPCPGDDVTLFVDSMPGVTYQWYKDGNILAGATDFKLFLPNIQTPADSGAYHVIVTFGDCEVMVQEFNLNPDSCGKPLPVYIAAFNAFRIDNHAKLEWITYSESDSRGFAIERSNDGKTWKDIGFVNSKAPNGNSTEMQQYDFLDTHIDAPLHYYRLRQTDRNGTLTYSIVRMLRFGDENKTALYVYPNPANNTFYMDNLEGEELVRITDQSGKLLSERIARKGKNTFSVSGIAAGVYLVEVIDRRGNVRRTKLVITP